MIGSALGGCASRRQDQRGSTLLLMPAAVLVVMILGAIAVDSAVVFNAQRELVNATQAAANDAVTHGLNGNALRAGRGYQYDRTEVESVVQAAFTARHLTDVQPTVTIEGPRLVVHARRTVRTVFSRAVPGVSGNETVTATADAEARQR